MPNRSGRLVLLKQSLIAGNDDNNALGRLSLETMQAYSLGRVKFCQAGNTRLTNQLRRVRF